jgi:DNA-binding response OmpR family regulator
MHKILMVGMDLQLLASRAAVLSKVEAAVICCSPAGFTTDLNEDNFDLIVICHTLDGSMGRKIIEESRYRWPGARTLQVLSIQGSPLDSSADELTPCDPLRLIAAVAKILKLDRGR